ncbi:MAG: hypothetical protein QNJ41_24570 [Xenococcaceae cyanobacterium MO_188.B32]|nr:hypothetical protein [Xenococcaceae cyanobacterium MO_188.B32]
MTEKLKLHLSDIVKHRLETDSACSEISSALVTQQITVETQESTQKG